ncbi:hypothetical protein LO763_14150 [Glycomyces sp. A-F 0318]|uniref:hypothetical protein n=1 Tax=Glycomyces amatae TaxID=2881355 RepID=UPI001E5A59B3|nr:hypothetical protein [Glycomyces amatae]MCD0444759.1 hypothetical protein [Glycomyces amatae]
MTSKELLHRLIDGLDEARAVEVLTWLRARLALGDPARDGSKARSVSGSFSRPMETGR